MAVALATTLFSLYSTWRTQEAVRYPLGEWVGVVLLGAACSPVLWAWNSAGPVRFGLFVAIFTIAAMALGLARLSEGKLLLRAVRRQA